MWAYRSGWHTPALARTPAITQRYRIHKPTPMKSNILDRAPGLSTAFAIHCTLDSKEFIADCKKLLKGTGFGLRLRGRGPRTAPSIADTGYARCYDQSIPLSRSTYCSVYVGKNGYTPCPEGMSWQEWSAVDKQREAFAAGIVLAVAKIYALHDKDITVGASR